MDVPPTLPKKKDVLEALLAESNVFLHLDPRRDGVVVPRWFQNQPELTLQVGLNMPVPIRDLEVDENGVSCTLSFSRTPFWCSLPWTAIFAIVSEPDRRGGIWPEDVPPDGQWGKSFRSSAPPPAKRERPKLTALGPNDRPPEEVAPAPAVGADSKCGACGTKWIEDQTSCPVCGASISEMVGGGADRAAASKDEAAAPISTPVSSGTPAAAGAPRAPSKPVLAPAPAGSRAPDRPVLVRKKGGRASAPAGAEAGAPAMGSSARRKGEKPKAVPRPKPMLAPPPAPSDPGRAVDKPAAKPVSPAPMRPVGKEEAIASLPDRVAATDIPGDVASSAASTPEAPASPRPPSRGVDAGGKKTGTKRELPPYLRVVK